MCCCMNILGVGVMVPRRPWTSYSVSALNGGADPSLTPFWRGPALH